MGHPVPLHQPAVIGGIHNGVLTTGQRDKFDSLIERLDNDVSFHVVLHGLSEKEIVRPVQPLFLF
jgi:hypothetical protein